MNPFFGIRIATYRRPTGTFHLIARCLKSILAQTFTNWKVFLIGDQYEPDEEFQNICALIPSEKIHAVNIPFSPERNKYKGQQLWRVAGHTADCLGIELVKKENIPVVCCLDDDDFWTHSHLETLYEGYMQYPDAAFIYTQSTYRDRLLPEEKPDIRYNNFPPQAYKLIHSAASWDVRRIPITYRNINEIHSPYVAADADLWENIRNYCDRNGLKTLYIPKLTVRHDYEQHVEPLQPLLL